MQNIQNFNSNHSNLAFESEVNKFHDWMRSIVIDCFGYSKDVILERLVQRFVELSLPSFVKAIRTRIDKGDKNPFNFEEGSRINCGKYAMELGTGRIRLTIYQWLKNMTIFLVHWCFNFLVIIFSCFYKKNNKPATLSFGVAHDDIFKNGIDADFLKYCKNGSISPLSEGNRFLIECATQNSSSKPEQVTYCSNPLITLFRETRILYIDIVRLILGHIFLLFSYIFYCIRIPQLTLLGREIAYSGIAFMLDNQEVIESVILTCSNYTTQLLWTRQLRNSSVHMIWYAQNWNQIQFVGDESITNRPSLRWIRADKHWVWTKAFSRFLESLEIGGSFEIVGPIVWYVPEMSKPENNVIKIVIFDVSPFEDDVALKNGQLNNYHNPENLYAFINNILSMKENLESKFKLPVIFSVKTKRGYKNLYDKQYFEYLDELKSKDLILLEQPTDNIYALISGCNLVIAYPFTSPVYIAEYLGVPGIYYDPTGTVCPHDFGDSENLIMFCNSSENLINTVIASLSSAIKQEDIANAIDHA